MRPTEPTGLPGTRIVLAKNQSQYESLVAHTTGEHVYTRWELDENDKKAILDGACVELITWTYGQLFQPIHLRVQGVEEPSPISDEGGRRDDLEELRGLVNAWIERPPAARMSPASQELFDNAVRPLLRRTER